MDRFIKVLAWFRLLDENAQLSITNIAAMVIVVKVALAPSIDAGLVTALLGGISAYSFKRYIQRCQHKPQEPFDKDVIQRLQDQVKSLEFKIGLKR